MQKQSARIKCKNDLFKPASDIIGGIPMFVFNFGIVSLE